MRVLAWPSRMATGFLRFEGGACSAKLERGTFPLKALPLRIRSAIDGRDDINFSAMLSSLDTRWRAPTALRFADMIPLFIFGSSEHCQNCIYNFSRRLYCVMTWISGVARVRSQEFSRMPDD